LASPLSHYLLLQVPEEATPEQLRQAFRRLSKRFHPDTTSLPAVEAEQAFQRLQHAYGVLSDPEARRRYDAELRLARLTAVSAARAAAAAPSGVPAPPGPQVPSVRRALSGGEWLALLLLALALVFSLVLGVGLALVRGAAFSTWPSWLPPT
jgi:curved DNA-binding protein CbpA